jgi:hypothetical protein
VYNIFINYVKTTGLNCFPAVYWECGRVRPCLHKTGKTAWHFTTHAHTHTHTHTHTEPKRCWCDNRVVCKIWYAVANQFERFSLEHKCFTAYCNTLQLATTALEACTIKLGYHSGGMKRSLFILSISMMFQVYSPINNIKYRCLQSFVCMGYVRGWAHKATRLPRQFPSSSFHSHGHIFFMFIVLNE